MTKQGITMKQIFAGLALAASCLAANAYELTFTGRITYTNGSLGGVSVGSLIQGSFVGDDPQKVQPIPAFPNMVYYSFSSAQVSASVEGHSIVSTKASISIFDNFDGNVEDQLQVNGAGAIAIDGVSHQGATFNFALGSQHGNTGALVGVGLPTSIDLSAFDKPFWNQGALLLNGGQNGGVLSFDILSVKVAAVPEPTSAWLVLAGGLAVAAIGRRRARPLQAAAH